MVLFEEKKKKSNSCTSLLLLTFTFLFIARSGDGERDGVADSIMIGFCFFRAREEESSRPLISSPL